MERDLVEQAQRGDQEAFAILARTRGDVLFGIARRIVRDVALAEDAVQQTLAAHSRWGRTVIMSGQHNTERILDAFLAPESERLADRVIDAALADIARTPQRRALRVPWRFALMTNATRAAAGIALIAIVAVGVLALNLRSPSTGSGSPTPTLTAAPTETFVPSEVAPGITGWTTYASANYPGLNIGYPADWSVRAPATRAWQAGDDFPADELPYADSFVSPGEGDAQIGLLVWEMPHDGEGGPDTFDRLKVWAETFCNDVLASSCEDFTQHAIPMCRLVGDGCDGGDGAILVPTAGLQFAFFRTWQNELFDSTTVRVVVIAREDGFPAAARYGGSVELLRSILSTMDVWTLGQQPRS